ncbi:MAG: hypothetical protein QJR12_07320 [Mycobacterium sp.]|uniref:hypothetical protein n=1 Tax=Mycobacterium sp. TaxID=1785 RepID=UPI00260F5B41|nr:hypothetical protein [Mycobacterium sp.]MDI3314083.1 hypothetical protein [Mycobacterium sp.]
MTFAYSATEAAHASNLAALFRSRVAATPDKEAFRYPDDARWVSMTWRDTAARGVTATSYEELVRAAPVRELVAEHVGRLNAGLNRWETIKKWALLERDLTVECVSATHWPRKCNCRRIS